MSVCVCVCVCVCARTHVCFLFFSLVVYYCSALSSAHKKNALQLKEQLVMVSERISTITTVYRDSYGYGVYAYNDFVVY